MKKEMEIQTPVLASITTAGAKLVGMMPGWVDPEEVCAVLSGSESVLTVQQKDGGKTLSGSELTTLVTRGGQRIMVMGTAEKIRNKLRQSLGLKSESKPVEQAE